VFGLQKIVKDFAKQIHSRKDGKGRVTFINRTKPAESVWEDVIDRYVAMERDDWVRDLRVRKQDLCTTKGNRTSSDPHYPNKLGLDLKACPTAG
jgi:predicted acetyltransferase